ncbi:MAG TPA: dTDP-4-amino-4,6-dideoxygalactose transaminase [Chitinophagaceae bacterium]|nr:dTDP-4-amino-4,6-dideoxygalactose transaminase [Chitinophagaceae bacterium]
MGTFIPFNKPYLSGNELKYIKLAIAGGKISGDGVYTGKCHEFFEKRFGFLKCLLTTSCTDALEMAAILINIQPGDEVIMPSFTFVSTANAFVLRGAKIVFADSKADHPGMDEDNLENLVTKKTKAIVTVHYAGIACDMHKIMTLADKYNLFVIEDAAQAIDSYYTFPDGTIKALGSIGHLAAFSFHETKNIISGEGGMIVINDEQFTERAEIIREKGTNRSKFFRGEIDKYGWVDIGSSFLPSDIIAAFLYAQLENFDKIQEKRKEISSYYAKSLVDAKGISFLPIPGYATDNAHMFPIICESIDKRSQLIRTLKENNVMATFHYQSLHNSPYFSRQYPGIMLPNSEKFADRLMRLPMYYELEKAQLEFISNLILHAI